MSNHPNLPFTRFRHSGPHIGGVEPVARDERTLLDDREAMAAAHSIAERITRRRRMSSAEVGSEIDTWNGEGAHAIAAPHGWRAWERTRRDAVTGGDRVLRIAITDHAPHDVVNWSAPAPLARGEAVPPDERLWFAWWSHWRRWPRSWPGSARWWRCSSGVQRRRRWIGAVWPTAWHAQRSCRPRPDRCSRFFGPRASSLCGPGPCPDRRSSPVGGAP